MSSALVQPDRHHPISTSRLTKDAIEIDHGSSLYFVCFQEGFKPPPPQPNLSTGEYGDDDDSSGQRKELFCGTDDYVYQHFFADFGPLHLGHVYAFCTKLGRIMEGRQEQQQEEGAGGRGRRKRPVYVYSSEHPHRRSNAAVLVLAYAVLCLGKTAEDAYAPFFGVQPPLIPYRDASFGICTYHLEVLDCVRALARAASLGHFNLDKFNPEQYAFYDKIEHGDLNWIIPGKFVAFSGPLANRREVEPGKWTLLAEDYVSIFRKLGVTCVVRFNKKCYDRRRLTEGGIKHIDLFYEDGGNPSEEILQRFLKICENVKGAIAVHCKAGLGRTGTNIALYMMKHYGYTAAESIALCRICRPGSIVGPQQQFLHDLEHRMKSEGDQYRRRHRKGGGGRGANAGAAGNVIGTAFGASSAPSHSDRHRGERRLQQCQHQPYLLADSGSGVGGDGGAISSPPTRRPTTSPLLMRRHSTVYSGGDGRGRGAGAMSPTQASRRRSVGNRWTTAEEELVVSGGGAGGSRGFRGVGSGKNSSSRGRGLGKGAEGSSSSNGLQRRRRGSSPLARQHNGDGGGRGGGRGGVRGAAAAGEDVGDLMETLRLSSIKGAAEGGGIATDRAPVASTARGKLVPLAASPARPTTSTTVARNRRKLSAGAVALRPEELARGHTNNNLGLTTSPVSPKTSATVAGNANANGRASSRSGNRTAARSAAAPGKVSLAWQHPVDKSSRRGSVDHDEAGRFVRDGHEHHSLGRPWAATESPCLGAGAPER